MKKYISYAIMVLCMSFMCISFCVGASQGEESRKKIACVNAEVNVKSGSCMDVSSTYTIPYCLSLSEPIADNSLQCIRASLTNTLSNVSKLEEGSNTEKNIPLVQFEMRDIIGQYCKALLGTGNVGRIYYAKPSNTSDSWDWQQTFDSHQSIFVNALCSSFKDKDGGMPFVSEFYLGEIFKDEDIAKILKLRQRSGGKDLCSLADYKSLEDCDMSVYATEIFSAIMSDIFKIKYAQVLHIDTVKDFGSKQREKVVAFMSGYFNMDDINWDYRKLKATFPQTVSVLESNQKYYKDVLKTMKILDNSELADLAEKLKCPVEGNMVLSGFIACALHSSQAKGFSLTPSFVTLFYNELINYRVFESYINWWIAEKEDEMSRSGNNEKDIRRFMSKSLDFKGYVNIQREASKQALIRFEDFNMTYPFHIGLLLYLESMKNFRDNRLSPIVTLFYSLSEKLQNVQLPN